MNRTLAVGLGLLLSVGIAGCQKADAPKTEAAPAAAAAITGAEKVTTERLLNAASEPQQWMTYNGTYSEQRYSTLSSINKDNVKTLGLAWFADYDTNLTQAGTPLAIDGAIYVSTAWSKVYAFDARTGKQLWQYNPQSKGERVAQNVCCGIVNRGIAAYNGKIYVGTLDGRLVAIDSKTGKPVWETMTIDESWHYSITSAPRVAKGKVFIGNSGGEYGVRGYIGAYDAETGKPLWRFYTVPGDPSKPFENEAMKKAAGTWDSDWWKRGGGGAVWDGMAYDPDADLVYVGTGNAEPWAMQLRSSRDKDNLYVCSILAVSVETGELKWHYQVVPGDNWDYDSVQNLILADLSVDGRRRKVIMQAPKNGFYYVIDRITGQFISAQPYSKVTWAKGIDPKTGRPIVNPEAYYGTEPIAITPGGGGAHNWSPMSFNPMTGLTYIPTSTSNTFTYAAEATFDPQPGRTTGTVRPAPTATLPPPPAIGPEPIEGTNRGALVAWDPVAQQMRWRVPGGGGIGGGTVTTAGNLVFQVLQDGRLRAYSADKGEKLLEIDTGLRSGMGPPITYRIDGRQYVAVMGGVGNVTGNAGPGNTATAFNPKLMTFALGATTTTTR